jgi:hypothetical protein
MTNIIAMLTGRGPAAGIASAILGLVLIGKGLTGDVWRSARFGDTLIPRWAYIAAGALVITIGVALFWTGTESGNRWLTGGG